MTQKARIVEVSEPFEPVTVDPVTLDIIESALRNARSEMDALIFRTAMSPGIREQHDAFPLIADRQGRMVVGQFGSFIYGFLTAYDGTVEPGDIFFTTDPYQCDGAISHTADWLVLKPIYDAKGRLIAWSSMIGHMSDVGGKVPGSLPTDAVSIFEEGVLVPPVKLYRGGELQEDLLRVVLAQVRIPDWNRSDLNALIAACRTAERRVLEICERFGVDRFIAAVDALLDRNRRAMRELIRRTVPENEEMSFEDYICDDGRGHGPYKLRCTMKRKGDKLLLDWSGTDPQAEGSINFYLSENMFKMFVGVYMIMVFDPQILYNDGFYDAIEVHVPEGSLLKPRFPAALSCRTHALGRVADILGAVLGQRHPEFLNAAGFSSSPHLMYSGWRRDGEWYQLYQIGFGGIPGRPVGDGPDGHSLWPSFNNVPNEFLEAYFPLRIERYETVPDSGGPGLHRGGNGVEIVYRFLEPGEISIHDDRWFTYPWGVNGGFPGARGRKILIRGDGRREVLPSKCDHVAVEEGDRLHFVTWGGGGWGDPLVRPAELVAKEVERGLVTMAGALRYGVVLREDITVDQDATARSRERMRAERGPVALFNFGPSIEELRRTCLEETGLPPPIPPKFVTVRRSSAG